MTDSEPLGQASIPAVNQYIQLAKAQQLDLKALLSELELTEAILADSSATISGLKFQHLIASLVDLSKDKLFGLHTAQFVQPGSYSVLGYIIMNCETLGDAITKIQPFEKLVGDMGTTTLSQQNKYFTITWSCLFTNELVKRHSVDNCLASWVTFARYLTNSENNPVQILLSRSEPSLSECTQYQNMFNCSVLFNQSCDAIIFDRELLSLPLNKGNKQILSALEEHANEIMAKLSPEQSIVNQTQDLIRENLSQNSLNQHDIAKQLGLSAKTLQRKLKAEHASFKALVTEIRLVQAKAYLTDITLTANQISTIIGFAEPRSFYRWFQKETSLTPGQYRKLAKDINNSNSDNQFI